MPYSGHSWGKKSPIQKIISEVLANGLRKSLISGFLRGAVEMTFRSGRVTVVSAFCPDGLYLGRDKLV